MTHEESQAIFQKQWDEVIKGEVTAREIDVEDPEIKEMIAESLRRQKAILKLKIVTQKSLDLRITI